MKRFRKITATAVGLAVVLAAATAYGGVRAGPISCKDDSDKTDHTIMTDVPYLDGMSTGLRGWWIREGDGSRTDVILSEAYSWWMKMLWGDEVLTNFTVEPGEVLVMRESLTISGSASWREWHEYGLWWSNPWAWGGAAESEVWVNGGPLAGTSISVDPQGFELVIDFGQDLPPGTTIDIWKPIHWNGESSYTTYLEVDQWPLPEPASMTILGLGGAALLRRRRRRNA